jgi:hypothetical protein
MGVPFTVGARNAFSDPELLLFTYYHCSVMIISSQNGCALSTRLFIESWSTILGTYSGGSITASYIHTRALEKGAFGKGFLDTWFTPNTIHKRDVVCQVYVMFCILVWLLVRDRVPVCII